MLLIALAVLAADPASLTSVIGGAHGGDVVRLAAGRYGLVRIKGRTFDPPLRVIATAATVAAVQIFDSTGVSWEGGSIAAFVAPGTVASGRGF